MPSIGVVLRHSGIARRKSGWQTGLVSRVFRPASSILIVAVLTSCSATSSPGVGPGTSGQIETKSPTAASVQAGVPTHESSAKPVASQVPATVAKEQPAAAQIGLNCVHHTDTLTSYQLPDLSQKYNQCEGLQLTPAGAGTFKVAADAARIVFKLQLPQLLSRASIALTALTTAGAASDCVQNNGMLVWRVYTLKNDLTTAAITIIASQGKLLDTNLVASCAFQVIVGAASVTDEPIAPCIGDHSYTTHTASQPSDTYYAYWAASKMSACSDIGKILNPR